MQTLTDAAAALRRRETTALALTEAAIARHEETRALNAFITFDGDTARETARALDADAARGHWRGPLHGLPISVKDLIDVRGLPTTAGSRVLPGTPAADDAPCVRKLRDAGAVLIGKTNLHEFAFGTTSEDSAFGPVRHPRDRSRMAGGSSGGSAAAVAAGVGLGSVGTDTGGSIRIPAAVCGLVGLKPTYGEISATGVVPLSLSFDHVGPITRTVADAVLLWSVMRDAGAVDLPDAPRAPRLGVPREYFFDLLQDEVRGAWASAVRRLEHAGVDIVPVSIPNAASTPDAYVPVVFYESYAWHRDHLLHARDRYTPAVGERLAMGADVTKDEYERARAIGARLADEVDAALAGVDALALPTMAVIAPPLGTSEIAFGDTRVPVRSVMLRLTQLFDISGHPAITLPMSHDLLPTGLQLVGRRNETAALLALAAALEPQILARR